MPGTRSLLEDDDFGNVLRRNLQVFGESAGRIGGEFLAKRLIFPAAFDDLRFQIVPCQYRNCFCHLLLHVCIALKKPQNSAAHQPVSIFCPAISDPTPEAITAETPEVTFDIIEILAAWAAACATSSAKHTPAAEPGEPPAIFSRSAWDSSPASAGLGGSTIC